MTRCLIIITYETSFTVRGTTGATIQPHQILRLSRRKTHILIVVITYETSFTVSGATGVTIQPHQILRLSRRKSHILSPHHIWNVIYSARSNRCHDPTSPNTAPATQKDSHASSSSHMKRHLQCAEQQASPSNITKYCACHTKFHFQISLKIFENSWNVISNAGTIREWSENDPTMKPSVRNPPRNRRYFSSSPRAFSMEKYNVSRPILHSNLHQGLRLPRKVTLELHQVLHLPRKVTLELHQILRLPRKVTLALTYLVLITYETSFTVRGATGLPLQHHQILRLPHKIAVPNFWQNLWKQVKRHFQCGDDPSMIRAWSEHDPRMIREWKRKPQPASQVRLLFEVPRSIFYCKIQRFAPNLTFKPSPSAPPTTKSNTWTSPSTAPATKSDTWTSPNTAPTTKSNTGTSPNTAPATKSDTWTSPNTAPTTKSNTGTSPSTAPVTQNWIAKFLTKSLKTGETSFPMQGRSEHDPSMIRAWSENDPRMKTQTATRLASEVTFRGPQKHFLL